VPRDADELDPDLGLPMSSRAESGLLML